MLTRHIMYNHQYHYPLLLKRENTSTCTIRQKKSSIVFLYHQIILPILVTMTLTTTGSTRRLRTTSTFVSAWQQQLLSKSSTRYVGWLQQQQPQQPGQRYQTFTKQQQQPYLYNTYNNQERVQKTFSRLFSSSSTTDTSSSSTLNTTSVSSIPTAATDIESISKEGETEANTNTNTNSYLIGIEWVQDIVVEVLNELYDYKEVARGQVLAKIQKQQKQKGSKKKKKTSETDTDDIDVDTSSDSAVIDSVVQKEQEELIIQEAINNAKPFTRIDAMVTKATKMEYGDYQINAAMQLSQSLNIRNPHDVAQQIINKFIEKIQFKQQSLSNNQNNNNNNIQLFDIPTIAGPGFINLKLTTEYLQQSIQLMANDASTRLGIPTKKYTTQQQKIIVDYSSPNIAKEMHVGHLRSTIIGDTICNVLEFVGHDVVRLNHVGDWGTQFGMLVEHLRDEYPEALNIETSQNVQLGDLVTLYKAAKKRFDVDDDFKQRARDGVVKLQAGNKEELVAWESLCAASRYEYQKIYDLLNIQNLVERGESFYNPLLQNVVSDLENLGLAVQSDGATAVFLDGYTNRDGTSLPMIVRKSDGGYNYATTDLAAIRHRTSIPAVTDDTNDDNNNISKTIVTRNSIQYGEQADRVLYVTDSGQSQHFQMVFDVARKAQFVPIHTSLEHVPFGLVQGADGKKFATRSGDTVKLKDLLYEAITIAGTDLRTRQNNFITDDTNDDNNTSGDNDDDITSDLVTTTTTTTTTGIESQFDRIARIVGIGAVKYADLSMNRESNYKFSYDRMLSLNGNTAPYMLYAYVRICGIIRKASGQGEYSEGVELIWPKPASEILLSHETEIDLIRTLIKLPDIINDVEYDLYPHKICEYLFDTSQKFNKFYENCSVNNAETIQLKNSRLTICTATAGTIRLLLTLLGIELVDKL